MPVRKTSAGAVELAYETFGEPGRPPVLLVMGIGSQMINWHEDFCTALALGRYVIRYDNRDCGRSTKLDDQPVDLGEFITSVTSGDLDRALAVAKRLRTGQVSVNGGAFNPLAPFGGYKQSGHGRELGKFGLEEFLEVKSLQL